MTSTAKAVKRVGRVGHQRPCRLEGRARLLPRVDEHPAEHGRPDAVRAELESRDHAELAAAPAQRPEEVRVLVRRCPHDLAIGEDDLGGEQRIDRQAVVAHEPPDAAAERQPADAGVRDLPPGHREPVLLAHSVELAQQRTASDPHDGASRIDLDAVQGPQVDAQRAVTQRAPGDRVASAAHRERQACATRRADRRADIVGIVRVGDGRRVAIDRAVPACAGGVVVGVAGFHEATDEAVGAQAGGKRGGEEWSLCAWEAPSRTASDEASGVPPIPSLISCPGPLTSEAACAMIGADGRRPTPPGALRRARRGAARSPTA